MIKKQNTTVLVDLFELAKQYNIFPEGLKHLAYDNYTIDCQDAMYAVSQLRDFGLIHKVGGVWVKTERAEEFLNQLQKLFKADVL